MSETPPTLGEAIRNYHDAEKKSLEDSVAKGSLREVNAGNGKMYVLPLETEDFPVAISIGDMIIRSGDKVTLKRRAPGGRNVEATTPISGFHINENNHEIEGHMQEGTPSILRVNDIEWNRSAQGRVLYR